MARRNWAAALVVAIANLGTPGMPSARQLPSVSVDVAPFGVARGNGVAAVTVFVTCSQGTVMEALLTLSQDEQAISGMGGIPSITCDGVERRYVALVEAPDGDFHAGPAFASTYVLVCDNGNCASDGPSATVTLRGRPAR